MGFVNLENYSYTFTALNEISDLRFCNDINGFSISGCNIYNTANVARLYLWMGMIDETPPDPVSEISKYYNFRTLSTSSEFANQTPTGTFWYFFKATAFASDFKIYLFGGKATWA